MADICKKAAMKAPEMFQKFMEIASSSAQAAFEIKEHLAFCASQNRIPYDDR